MTSITLKPAVPHVWKFQRKGGLDQVILSTGDDLLALDQLDPKLWVALSCPVKGIELDEKTLSLIDSDQDGRIRVPELIAAIQWAAVRLDDPGDLLKGSPDLPLAAINDSKEDGKILLSSARQILANIGKPEAASISASDTADTARIYAANPLNGDGVIPPEATEDAAVQALIKDIIACIGGIKDRTGSEGVTAQQIDQFFSELTAYQQWVEQSAAKDIAVLGEATDAAVAALRAVRPKVDDFFGRCRLAAFDARATSALNRAESEYLDIAARDLRITADEVKGFPLARIEGGRALPLLKEVNPAWAEALARLHKAAVSPVLGPDQTELTEADWIALNAKFAPYETWLGGKAGSAVEALSLPRVKAILADQSARDALVALVKKDQALEPEFKAISDVDRLVHYYRDLNTLVSNFVNFSDFYARDRLAVFQAGTLYLDSRSTELCIGVAGASPLAAMSKTYIAYCDLTRAGEKPRQIAACFTQGDSDYLFVGRHGIFYDRKGRDWDATVTSLVDNPTSIRQAFVSPYKKFVRMIEEQAAKRAAAAEAESTNKLAAAAANAANVDKLAPVSTPVVPKKVDVGTVAALGVAVTGAISALTLILGYVLGLSAWQYPFVLLGLVLVISTPSMVIAWLKLRQRTLGPILEATGWAINGRVKITAALARKLTQRARLPDSSRRSLADPFGDTGATVRRTLLITLLVLLAAAAAVRWDHNRQGQYFWQPDPVEPVIEPAPPPTQG